MGKVFALASLKVKLFFYFCRQEECKSDFISKRRGKKPPALAEV